MSNQTGSAVADNLSRFKAAWQSGSPPSLRAFLAGSRNDSLWRSLIAIDLEFRWRDFSTASTVKVSPHEFPRFPRLEDYAVLLNRTPIDVLDAKLLAAEYRVRQIWGDRPEREEVEQRFAGNLDDLRCELDRVDSELSTSSHDSLRAGSRDSTVDWPPGKSTPVSTPVPLHLARIGKYQTIRLLGRGGFGEVWLAEHPQLRRMVAIKIPRRDRQFSPEQLAAFRRESRQLASLGHIPGVVKVFDADECDGVPFIVSDFIEGESLDVRLKRLPPSAELATAIVASVAQSLHRAHLLGLTHRDVKPANILLDKHDQPHLADFGLSVTEEEQLLESPALLGTFAYMSPEQANGGSHLVDGRSDLYSLGVVFYQLLTRRLPFIAEGPDEYIELILSKEPRPPRSIDDRIPKELERICLNCLRKSPSDRYTTAADLADDLAHVWRAARTPASQSRAATLGVILLCISGGLIAMAYASRRTPVTSNSGASFASNQTESPSQRGSETLASDSSSKRLVTPKVVITSKPQGNNFFQVSEEGGKLNAASDGLLLLRLGTIERADCILEISAELSSLKSAYGSAGIFVGLRSSANQRKDQFQTFWIQRDSKRGDSCRRSISSFEPESPAFRDGRDLSVTPLEGARKANTLRIVVSQGRLKELFWNGQQIETRLEQSEESGNDDDLKGTFGVFVNRSVAVFSGLKMDEVPMEFGVTR